MAHPSIMMRKDIIEEYDYFMMRNLFTLKIMNCSKGLVGITK